jgi:hypothetical protein
VLSYLLQVLGEVLKQLNARSVSLMDSFPIPACDTIRIPRSKRYRQGCYRGYTASQRGYFYGVKLSRSVTAQGEPVERVRAPGSTADVSALPVFNVDLPHGRTPSTATAPLPSTILKR